MKKLIFVPMLAALVSGCMASSNDNVGVGGAPGTAGVGAGAGVPGAGGVPGFGGAPASGGSGAFGSGGVAAGGTGGAPTGGSGGGAGGSGLPPGCFTGASVQCNPLTNAGCTGGAACDIGIDESQQVHLTCYPPPNPAPVGGSCNATDGPFCVPGSLCTGSPGTCIPFCCSSNDCAPGSECLAVDPAIGTIGGCTPSGSGGGGGMGGSGGSSGGGGSGGFDLINCTGKASTSGTVAGVTPKASVATVQPDPAGNVKLILLPKANTTNGDIVVGVYFFAQPGQMSYPPNGSVGCAIMEYQNGWKVLDKSQLCEVSLTQLKFASQKDVCDGVMAGTFKGIFSGNAPFGGSFAVPLELAASQVKAPSCQGMNGPCSAHSDCCSQSCSLFIGVCN